MIPSSPTTHHHPHATRYYQLTHDYLVPSLWDWLTRKQKETRRGRAELLLADRAAVWNARQENRQLPSLRQWLCIRWLTPQKNWTPPQWKMMRKAGRYHVVRVVVVALILTLIGWGSYEGRGTLNAHALRDRLLDANTNEVPTIVQDMAPYRRWLDPLLHEAAAQAQAGKKDARKQLHASLALLPVDPGQVVYLYDRLLDAEPHELPVIRDALASHKDELPDKLWAVVESPDKGRESQRLRAAAALAKYDPESQRWTNIQEAVANDLVNVPAVYLAAWMESLRPVRHKLYAPLSDVYRNVGRRDVERSLATDILAEYAADQPNVLADLLMDADDKQFSVIYPKLKDRGEQGLPVLIGEIDRKLPVDAQDDARETLANRQANAAVALLKMDRPEKAWPLLKHTPDPRVRSYLIHRLYPLGADPGAIVKRLDEEPDVTIRRALILSLGEYEEREVSPDARQALFARLQDIYRTEADPGLHAACEWLLRTWKQEAWLKQVNEEWASGKVAGSGCWVEGRTGSSPATRHPPPATSRWYVNGQGQMMVVIPGPVEFMMGAPPTEKGRQEYEPQHKKRIGRTFALAAKSVTVEQYRQFDNGYTLSAAYTRTADLPVVRIDWYMAAAYCNWLSKEEGINEDQWCYEINGQTLKLKANDLSLSGYRLPTEAEMEYATRAGAMTARYYGETEELLPKYAWYQKNSQEQTWPVGSLKPNDFGLFDVQGNVFTWCQESHKAYPTDKGEAVTEDQDDEREAASTVSRVLRGGSFIYLASVVRSASRFRNVPVDRSNFNGFRLARTVPFDSFTALPSTPRGGRK